MHHWALVGAFVLAFIVLLSEEARSQKAAGTRLTTVGATHLINRENAVVLDLREANAFREGHIIGSKNFPESEFERNAQKLEQYRSQPIILVDAMGAKASVAALRLKKLGFEKVNILKGGISAWKSANMPVVKS